MPFIVYEIRPGVYCTTDQPYDGAYISSWEVSEPEAQIIADGAAINIVDEALVIEP